MFCELKSDIKLASNVVIKEKGDKIGLYIPVDLKKPEDIDTRLLHNLTEQQQSQVIKGLFYAKEVRYSNERFSDLAENADMCKDCPHKNICY